MSAFTSIDFLFSTKTPIECAEPITDFTADFRLFASMLSFFIFAIFIACSIAMFPILSLLGIPEPFCALISFAISCDTGGVPIFISKLFSSVSTITLTGTFMPLKSDVFLLISLIICPMFTPSGPKAGPRGGAALAFPPSISASTVCFFPILLFAFRLLFSISPYDFNSIKLYSYWYWNSSLQKLYYYLVFLVVYPCYLGFFPLERPCYYLYYITFLYVDFYLYLLKHVTYLVIFNRVF